MRILFFATRTDMLDIVSYVEEKFNLKYILAHHLLFPEYGGEAPVYSRGSDIRMLGIATRQQTVQCERYIVSQSNIEVLPMVRICGGEKTVQYEMGNCPDSIELTSGGVLQDGVIISGLVQSWSTSKVCAALMRRFAGGFRKRCPVKIGPYFIGSEALVILKNGGRLTINIEADSSFDVKLSG